MKKNRLLFSKTANSRKPGKNLYIDKTLYTTTIYIYIYIVLYRHDSKMTKICNFATRFLTKPKEMGTIWTSRFEDKSLNFIAG